MAKTKSQPLDGTKDIATKRTQLSVKYMIDYVASHTDEKDPNRQAFKSKVSENRTESTTIKGTKKFEYDMKEIRDFFIKTFMPELKEKKKDNEPDPLEKL